ncbi:hypothetical protein HPB51_018649 [Rhipicephalus microplus]|uniref:Hemimethylated DNA-binding domain-containing protein n=1 Tax=Rhipicephalus microplus TaxID=6941 RepID=A0A9J6F5S2_RHIMP|nr:hypothetical protein HPB51_018649 [Rhipicephalus microplus]
MAAVFTKFSGSCKQIFGCSYPWKHATHAQYTRLAEVGRLETPKLEGKYDTGQLFLHRIFGYRGITLFPWMARVYDRDIPSKKNSEGSEEGSDGFNHVGREVKGKTHTYYQVLIDSRDCPYVVSSPWISLEWEKLPEFYLCTFPNFLITKIYAGLDYVGHDDILPYTSTEKQPLHHELFDKFLVCEPDKGVNLFLLRYGDSWCRVARVCY